MTQRQVLGEAVLRAQGLTCGRGGMPLVENLDLEIRPGTCLLLTGPNGTGKTTLLLTLAGLVAPMEGSVFIETAEDGPVLHHLGHRNAIKPRLGVAANLAFWAQVNGGAGMAIEEALEIVGLLALDRLDAGYLSAGQSRRLALARLLVSPRPIWLLDEPTAALDSAGHALVGRLLDRHLEAGGLAVIATHDAIAFADPARIRPLALGARP